MKNNLTLLENYLKDKINNSWYELAEYDYGIKGEVVYIKATKDLLEIQCKESDKDYTLTFMWPNPLSLTREQFYDIWCTGRGVLPPPTTTKKKKG